MSSLRKEDLLDGEIFDANELSSDGYFLYYSGVNVVDCVNPTSIVNVSSFLNLSLLDPESRIEEGDRIRIVGSNFADGYYTINNILSQTSFTVKEPIPNSLGGVLYFFHPSGASRIGFDNSNVSFTTSKNVQQALEDLDNLALPQPNGIGQVLFAINPTTFRVAMPITSNQGWLVNDQGILIVSPADGYD